MHGEKENENEFKFKFRCGAVRWNEGRERKIIKEGERVRQRDRE